MTAALATIEGSSRAVTYATTKDDIALLSAAYRGLSAAKDYEAVRLAIADLRGRRVAIEARRVDLKAEALSFSRKVDGAAKELTGLIEAIEEPLKAQKKEIDDAEARAKFQRENAERLEAEAKARADAETEAAARREVQEAEDRRLAEVARQQAIEADRILMENARLEADRKAEEKRAAAERDRLAAEAREHQKRLDDERAEHDRKLAQERAEQEAAVEAERVRLADERRKLDQEKAAIARAEADRQAAIKAEADAKAAAARAEEERARREEADRVAAEAAKVAAAAWDEAERLRLEALKPDVERVLAFADRIHSLASITSDEMPLRTKEASDEIEEVCQQLGELATRLEDFAEANGAAAA